MWRFHYTLVCAGFLSSNFGAKSISNCFRVFLRASMFVFSCVSKITSVKSLAAKEEEEDEEEDGPSSAVVLQLTVNCICIRISISSCTSIGQRGILMYLHLCGVVLSLPRRFVVFIYATFIPAVIRTAVDIMYKGTRHNTRSNGIHELYLH